MDKPINLKEVSGRFSYSLSSIKRIFKEETGCSIISYLNNLRMVRAKEMLLSSDIAIGEIAFMLGYSSVYYFSLAFKKKWGVSPSSFRNGSWGEHPKHKK